MDYNYTNSIENNAQQIVNQLKECFCNPDNSSNELNEMKMQLNKFALTHFKFRIYNFLDQMLIQTPYFCTHSFQEKTYSNTENEANEIKQKLEQFIDEIREKSDLFRFKFWVENEFINENETYSNYVWSIRVFYENK